ncbi:MAG TPA: ATP-binding cassette domain-containing protein, partial [Candidatus Eisenbacteria bacterium]
RVLVLDQATTHLDPGSRRAIEEGLVREALGGARGLVRTHQDARAPFAGEALHVLSRGELLSVAELSPGALLALGGTPFPLALRVSALLATQGRWEGPLATDAARVLERLARPPATGHAPAPAPRPEAWESERRGSPTGASGRAPRPLLLLENVGWTPAGSETGSVVEGIEMEVGEGEVVALLGRSGTGKSAILRLACGLIQPTAGSVDRATPAVKRTRSVALAMEHPERQLFGRTALEDVAALLWVAGVGAAERDRLARRALGEVGLDPDRFAERAPLSLSEGEKRRVALAGLLVAPPLVALLDEPTAGLDPKGRRALADSLRALRERGRAILLASHDLDFVGAVADRAVLLHRDGPGPGRVLASGPAETLLRDEPLLARAGLPPPDFVQLERALRTAGLLDGAAPRDGESLLESLALGIHRVVEGAR